MERTIESGKVREKVSFRVGANARPRKGRSRGNTSARKQDANERDCVKRAARILNCNFTHGDILLSLDFDDRHLTALIGGETDADAIRAAVEHQLDLFLQRVKRTAAKLSPAPEIKYFAVVSDMDGNTGELVRPHIHIIISGTTFEMRDKTLYIGSKKISALWGKGHADWQPLREQDDYTPVAEYLLRQVRRIPDAKKYKASRNMIKPRVVSERLVYRARPIKAPKGAKVMYQSEYRAGEPQYVRYIPARKNKKAEQEDEPCA